MSTLDGEAQLRVLRAVERFEDAWRRGEPIPLEDLLRGSAGAERDELLRTRWPSSWSSAAAAAKTRPARSTWGDSPRQGKVVEECFAEQPTCSVPRDFTLDDPHPATLRPPGRTPRERNRSRRRSASTSSCAGSGEAARPRPSWPATPTSATWSS